MWNIGTKNIRVGVEPFVAVQGKAAADVTVVTMDLS